MTEQEWLNWDRSPSLLFSHISRTAPARKLRLIGAGCCRLIWEFIPDARARATVVTIERYTDDLVTSSDFGHAAGIAIGCMEDAIRTGAEQLDQAALTAVAAASYSNAIDGLGRCIGWVVTCATRAAVRGQRPAAERAMREQISGLIREVIGNPFRPWKSAPEFLGGGLVQPDGRTVHLSDTARQLAHGIHVDQAFDRLPILADALEESGITDAALLAHCRNETRHVRGCWALDVALGRV